jgi:hypothetical protein
MMLMMKYSKIKVFCGLTKDIKAYYIRFRKSYNLLMKKKTSYTGGSEFSGVPAATGRSRQHRSRSTWG